MFKKYHRTNGVTVIASPMPGMTSVSIGVWIGVGGRFEPAAQSGISHLIEHMLFKGTFTRTAKGLKEEVEGVGGSFNGFTSDEVTCYMVKVPYKYVEMGMDVLSDMVINARFDKNDLAREKFVVCEEIKMYRDQPADHVMDLLLGLMWPGDPLGRPLTGNITTVKRLTRKEIVGFKERNYHPGNMAVVVAGRVEPARVRDHVMRKFAVQKRKKKAAVKSPRVGQKAPRFRIAGGDTKQAHLAMGFRALDGNSRERFAMKIMNVILGGNMSSRLFEELREKYGLCYDISSTYKRHSDVGELQIHAGVDNRKAARSVSAILDELKRMRDLGVTGDEMLRAKEFIKGQFLLAMEGTSTRMLWLGDRLMTHRHIPELSEVISKIDSVTEAEIRSICGKIFSACAVNLAIIGDIGEKDKRTIRKELNKL